MQTTFERLGITYRKEGDYMLPNIEVPESPQIGFWGQRRLQYLRTNKEVLYMTMLMRGTLKDHLEEVDKFAEDMFDQLVMQLKKRDEITEELKANNQLVWVKRMNAIRHEGEAIVMGELIYE